LISTTELDKELKNCASFMILAVRKMVKMSNSTILPEVTPRD